MLSGKGPERWAWQKVDLTISDSIAEMLVKIASDSDEEVCGFVIGEDRVQQIRNEAENPTHAWRMDHSEMMDCVREQGSRITAIWHSHPNNRDWPSTQDEHGIAFLYKQGCPWAYLIVTCHGVTQYAYNKEDGDVGGHGVGIPFGSDK